MKRMTILTAVFSFCALSAGAASAAEDGAAVNSLKAGNKSLSFGIPSGGNGYASGAAGVWMMMGDNMNMGFNVGLSLDRTTGTPDNVTSWDLLLAPSLRYYLATNGNVAPFAHGQLNLRLHSDGIDATDDDPELGLAGGLGVEWFVTPVFSVAGQVGLGIDVLRPTGKEPLALATFTSGLTAQIYFQ